MAGKFELNNTTPAAPAGRTNVQWQSDASGNVSASVADAAPAGPAYVTEVLLSKIYNVNLSNATSTVQTLASWTIPTNLMAAGDHLRIVAYYNKTGVANGYRANITFDAVNVFPEAAQAATDRGTIVRLDLIMLSATEQLAYGVAFRIAQNASLGVAPVQYTKSPAAGGVIAFRANWQATGTVDTLTLVSVTAELMRARG